MRQGRAFISKTIIVLLSCAAIFLCFGSAFAGDIIQSQQKVKSEGGYSKLLSKAENSGTVRLIITLDTSAAPMGMLEQAQAQLQVDAIARAQSDLHQSLAGHNVMHVTNFKYVPQIAMTVDRTALDVLVAHPSVIAIHEDIPRRHTLAQSVPLIGAPAVWGLGYTGAGVTVAILDTGVDKTHPFLNGAVVSEACYSSNYALDHATSICPGGVTSSTAVGSALPYAGTCPGPPGNGECDHGTHVAGIAAGRPYGSVTFSGVAPGASMIAIQIYSRFETDAECGAGYSPCAMAYDSDIISGLERVYALRGAYYISSVNLSLGGGTYTHNCNTETEKPSIDNLKSVNIATVIASGNDGLTDQISSPACISSAVSVGATTKSDMLAYYSNSASFLNLLAPGGDAGASAATNINSSVPGGGFEAWSGTSMATPHVTGAWALLRQARPSATVDQVLNALITTGLGITDTRKGHPVPSITKPRIRVDQALTQIACTSQPARIDVTSYATIQLAYDAATSGQTIKMRAQILTVPIFDRDISVTLQGGYDCVFLSDPGWTTLSGSLTISGGTVIIDNLIIK